MKRILGASLLSAALLGVPAYAAVDQPATNMEILRAKLQADKRLLVAAAMQLSDADGKKFWPVYDDYQTELEKINARTGKLIKDYAAAYNSGAGTLTGAQAKKLLDDGFAVESDELKLRRKTADKLTKALSAAHAARYTQVENKIRAAVRYELASEIPLAGIGEAAKK